MAEDAVTAEIVRRARAVAYDDLPDDVLLLARQCVLDWIAVTVAGSREECTSLLRAEVLEEGGAPRATLVGTGERVSLAQAALVNGTAAHALDYDDVSPPMSGHPSAPTLGALLAIAEERDVTGRELMTAFVAGVETACRVGRLMRPGHYAAGWHATGTVGTFGAFAAVASLLGLDEAPWRSGFGLAGTQAAGLKAMFGTMAKPLHAGKAAANGLTAARLAARGFTASPDVLDVAAGFAATQTTTRDPDLALELGPGEYDLRTVLFKFHASCYATHSPIEGALRLVREHALAPEDVEDVLLEVPQAVFEQANVLEPATGLEGKFSLRYTTALALTGRRTDESAFDAAGLADPAVVAVRDRIAVRSAPELRMPFHSRVVVRTRQGRRLEAAVDVSLPTPTAALPDQWPKLAGKLRGLVVPVLGEAAASGLVDAVASLESVTVRELVALATPAA